MSDAGNKPVSTPSPRWVYPEQVKFARMLTSRTFLEYVTDPARNASDRRALITREARKILPVWDDSESWRVTERIWDVARRLTQLRRDSLLWGAPARDAHYNLLRFIDLPELVIDDSGKTAESASLIVVRLSYRRRPKTSITAERRLRQVIHNSLHRADDGRLELGRNVGSQFDLRRSP